MSGCLVRSFRSLIPSTQLRRTFSVLTNSQLSKRFGMTEEGEATEAFRYTSGRWLYNESTRLDERYIKFNFPALLAAAARSVGKGPADVQAFQKLAEGGFNRIFDIAMRDGVHVVARLPYPLTQPKHLATASEVATMHLARIHGVPVPKVLGYSVTPSNPVGAEYILMEKVNGVSLGDVWFTMSDKERIKVLSGIVHHEAKLFAIELPANGSVFYNQDLPQSMERELLPSIGGSSQALCIGPDVSLKFWFEERSSLEIPRQPCSTPTEVLQGAAAKEIAWLKKYGKPRMPFDRLYRDITEFRKSEPSEHIESLERYIEVAKHLVPKESWSWRPTLRHPDLNPNNVIVSDEYDVVGIIDWQHSKALPLFLHAGIPGHFQNYGDTQSEDLVKPQLPADLDHMDEDDRENELEQYRRRHVHFYYTSATAVKNERHFDALMDPGGLFRRRVFEHAAEPWEGNSIPLKADLIQLKRHWAQMVGVQEQPPDSLAFDDGSSEKVLQAAQKQEEVDAQMEILRSAVGVGSDGWVSKDDYAKATAEAARLKAQAMDNADDDFERETIMKYWPFDDFDEKE